MFVILIRGKEREKIPDGKKSIETEVIGKSDNFRFSKIHEEIESQNWYNKRKWFTYGS